MKSISLSFVLVLFTLLGCSKAKDKKAAHIEVSLKSIIGATFSGGLLVKAISLSTGEIVEYEPQDPYNVVLPFGVWSLHIVGFEGSGTWGAPHVCGGASNFNFSEEGQKVQISVTTGACISEPYISLINSKAFMWDESKWDSASWQ
jgi:hypothetical protein